jgi:hypothetical protein
MVTKIREIFSRDEERNSFWQGALEMLAKVSEGLPDIVA